MDGGEVLKTVASEGGPLLSHEYIMITSVANTFPPDFIELLRRMSIRVLAKPFDDKALVPAVEGAVERLNASTRRAASLGARKLTSRFLAQRSGALTLERGRWFFARRVPPGAAEPPCQQQDARCIADRRNQKQRAISYKRDQ